MDKLIPEPIQKALEQAQAERERRLAERLAEIERERAAERERLEEEFGAYYASIETLVPEHLRPYVCAPQRFGEEKISPSYHFKKRNPHLAFDIPGLAPIIGKVEGGVLQYLVPTVEENDYDGDPVYYIWWREQATSDAGEALLRAREAYEEYWRLDAAARRRAEERERRQVEAAEARQKLAQMMDDPLLRLLALAFAQVQAEREEMKNALEEAQGQADLANSRAGKARREASLARSEADSLRWELERLEKALSGRGR